MSLQEQNTELGKIFGLKEGEVIGSHCSIEIERKDIMVTLVLKADSVKAMKVKQWLSKSILGGQ